MAGEIAGIRPEIRSFGDAAPVPTLISIKAPRHITDYAAKEIQA
jgi:hypothetical protein